MQKAISNTIQNGLSIQNKTIIKLKLCNNVFVKQLLCFFNGNFLFIFLFGINIKYRGFLTHSLTFHFSNEIFLFKPVSFNNSLIQDFASSLYLQHFLPSQK